MKSKGIEFRLEWGQRMTAFTGAFFLALGALVLHVLGLIGEGVVLGAFGMITTIAGLLQVFRGREKQQARLTAAQMREAEKDEAVARIQARRSGVGFGSD